MTRAGQSKISRRRPLRNGVLALTLSTPALAAGVRKKPIGDAMTSELTANEIVELLNLEPNATCGFVRVTFIAKQTLAAGALPPPFERSGPLGSALYFLVTPDAPVRLHRIRNDQLYHYYLGDPLELFLLHADGRAERVVVGPDLRGGQHVQLLIPGNTFHTARLLGAVAGFWARAPNGPASFRRMWKSAISRNWRRNILPSPAICARSRRPRRMSNRPRHNRDRAIKLVRHVTTKLVVNDVFCLSAPLLHSFLQSRPKFHKSAARGIFRADLAQPSIGPEQDVV